MRTSPRTHELRACVLVVVGERARMMGPLQAWQLEEPSLGEATRVPAESDRRRLREQAGPEARGGRTRARALRVHLHCAAQPRATGSHGCSAQCALARPRATGSHGRLCSASRTLSESLHARGASNVRTPNGHTAHEHDGSAACRSTTSPMGGCAATCRVADVSMASHCRASGRTKHSCYVAAARIMEQLKACLRKESQPRK